MPRPAAPRLVPLLIAWGLVAVAARAAPGPAASSSASSAPASSASARASAAVSAKAPTSARASAAAAASAATSASAAASASAAGAAGAAGEAGAAGAAGEAGAASAEETERKAQLERHRDALRLLLEGRLPAELTTAELVGVDIVDEAAVAARRQELRMLLARVGGAGGAGGASGAGGAGDEESRQTVEAEVWRLSLTFLERPAEERRAIGRVEEERRRLGQQQRSAEEQRRAAEEQRRASERARARALDEVRTSLVAEQRLVAAERARLEEAKGKLAEQRRRFAERSELVAREVREQHRTLFELSRSVDESRDHSDRADALYARVDDEWLGARSGLALALERLARPSAPARLSIDAAVLGLGEGQAAAVAELRGAATALALQAQELARAEQQLTEQVVDEELRRLLEVQRVRVKLLDLLSPGRRRELLEGGGAWGSAQHEAEHLLLLGRWARRAAPAAASEALHDPFAVGKLGLRLLLLGGAWAGYLWARRRVGGWLDALRRRLVRLSPGPMVARSVQSAMRLVRSLDRELLLLGAVLLLPSLAGGWATAPAFLLTHRLLSGLVLYRLAVATAWRLIEGAMRSVGVALDEGRVERSVVLVARWVLGAWALGVVLEQTLGAGTLYRLVGAVGWWLLWPLVLAAIGGWRTELGAAYLRLWPGGRAARALQEGGVIERQLALTFVAAPALGARLGATLAQRAALRFEQSRRALAYLFLKRLERRADAAEPPAEALPDDLCAALADQPPRDQALVLDRFPGLDGLDDALARWRQGQVGAVLVVGRTGHGKTTWLDAACARVVGLDVVRLQLERHLRSPAELASALARALGWPAASDLDALGPRLAQGRRVLVIDDLQNLFLRSTEGLLLWERFLALLEATSAGTFWLGAMAHYPYQYVHWARGGAEAFRSVVQLLPWSEGEISRLLRRRTAASGYQPIYDDLVVDPLEALEQKAQALSTEQDYMRLIWDYAEGCPRVALDCWQKSLTVDGPGRLRVRLFRRPRIEVLEALGERERFLLAAVVWHENLSVDDAALSLRFARAFCDDGLRRLEEMDILRSRSGIYRLTPAWWPGVIRFLRHKHLLES